MNTLQIERLLRNEKIFKKVCAFDQLEKPVFPSPTSSIPIRATNPENIGFLFILTNAVEENISIATD